VSDFLTTFPMALRGRSVTDEPDLHWDLVASQSPGAVRDKVVRSEPCPLAAPYEGEGHLAEPLIGLADHGGLGDGRMRAQSLFHPVG
jgi:hypothetical protein